MELLQDIHISDVSLWATFQSYWKAGNYQAALSLLENNSQLLTKYLNATWLNELSQGIYNLETQPQDPTFKSDKIQVVSTPPTLSSGEVYFQLTN